MDNASGTADELYDELTKKNNTLDRVAELMDCQPDDNADLCEAVRLLVQERDTAETALREEREALREVARSVKELPFFYATPITGCTPDEHTMGIALRRDLAAKCTAHLDRLKRLEGGE